MYDVAIIGGDIRQIYMAQFFKIHGCSVITYGLSHPMIKDICKQGVSLKETLKSSNILVSAIPFSKDGTFITSLSSSSDLKLESFMGYMEQRHCLFAGMIPARVAASCQAAHIPCYDFMADDSLAISNGIATAEGAIMEAISKGTGNLHKASVLVLGFGRCSKVLAHKLSGLDAKVSIGARKASDLALADAFGYDTCHLSSLSEKIGAYDYIFNTIPSIVLPEKLLCLISQEAVIVDIASAPGGLDYNAAKKLGLNTSHFLGIPGKVAPRASAEILGNFVISKMSCRKKVLYECER